VWPSVSSSQNPELLCDSTRRRNLPRMRIVGPKRPAPPKIKLTPGPKDAYGNSFAAVARCACGHDAQLQDQWVKLAAGYGAQLERAKARQGCRKCRGRVPRVEVYRVGP